MKLADVVGGVRVRMSMPGGVQHSDEGDFIIVEVADFRIL